jgi:hypothetical protein
MQFLVELSAIDDQDRPLEVFSEIRAITESVGFETELQGLFTEPSLLSKRWPALQEGLEDHKRGRYFSSVSVLLPQVEGVINDILTLKGSVIQQGKRFYARNADGLIGKELKGLQDKSALAKGAAQINEAMAKIVTSFIVPQRNGILHGVDVGYGTANLSTHLMVILLSLALGCAALEDELDHSVDLVPLLDGITEANLHGEIPIGAAVGREVW